MKFENIFWHIFFLFLLLTMLTSVRAENELDAQDNIILTLKNADTENLIIHSETYVLINDEIYLPLNNPNGQISFSLCQGEHNISIISYSFDASSNVFFTYLLINVLEENMLIEKEVILYPVCSVRGIIKDEYDNIVPNTQLQFKCDRDINLNYPRNSDKFGSFAGLIPKGRCRLYSAYEEIIGFVDMNCDSEKAYDVEIIMDQKIHQQNLFRTNQILTLVIIIVILFVFSTIFIFKKKLNLAINQEKKLEKKGKLSQKKEINNELQIQKLEQELRLGKRAKDIMETLKDKEVEIINFLASKNGTSTQAKIYYSTGIPKASLSRYIQALEFKNIITVIKIGKCKRIKLSPWFLAQEQDLEIEEEEE